MNDDLLFRYINGNCSEEERIVVAKWIDDDPKHLKEYVELRKLHDISIWQTETLKETVYTRNGGNVHKRSIIRIVKESLKIAAVIAITLLAYKLYNKEDFQKTSAVVTENYCGLQTLNVPPGQRAEITLEDGTKVWLNAGSTLVFPGHFTGDTREVSLDGEGFFEVSHNQENPFIIKTSNYDIKVLGTTFNLMAYSNSPIFKTMLLEGSVEIKEALGDEIITLEPNEEATLRFNKLEVSPLTDIQHLNWKDGIISFDDEPFCDLISELELYFDVKIDVQYKEILNKKYSGKFRTKDGIIHILNVFKLRHNFKFIVDEENNTITIIKQ